LRLLRLHGGLTFANLQDTSGHLQLFLKKDELGQESYSLFADNIDLGDFVEVVGELFVTQKGEKTLLVKKFKILTKALNQLPDKWHGLSDVEERFRRRYLDILMNEGSKKRFETRSEIIKNIRKFLEGEGFLEVETPILQALPGGALARPFQTHLNALDMDLYLRVAPELYLKRLLVAGFEKVYELGRCFRNEGMDKSHNPDFTILEFYWAYADYEQLMELTEELFEFLVPELEFEYQGQKIDLTAPFKRISMRDLLIEHYKIDIAEADEKELIKILNSLGEKIDETMPHCKMVDELFKTLRPKIIQPTFVLNHPLEMSPLAKISPDNKNEAARFQLLVGGMELINAYSELNDPQDQESRMKMQEHHREDEEIQRFDQDYIEALEYGMPPAAGWGIGIDRLVMLLTDAANLREVILFPTMREK
jgi:lysyl-tRNA synthetase class 2